MAPRPGRLECQHAPKPDSAAHCSRRCKSTKVSCSDSIPRPSAANSHIALRPTPFDFILSETTLFTCITRIKLFDRFFVCIVAILYKDSSCISRINSFSSVFSFCVLSPRGVVSVDARPDGGGGVRPKGLTRQAGMDYWSSTKGSINVQDINPPYLSNNFK